MRVRSALATFLVFLPASASYYVLLIAPLAIVVIFSFGERSRVGGYAGGFAFSNFEIGHERVGPPFTTSLVLAASGTLLLRLLDRAARLAFFIATRAGCRKSLLIVLLVIPFTGTSFLIRTYAWLMILGSTGVAAFIGDLVGDPSYRLLLATSYLCKNQMMVRRDGGQLIHSVQFHLEKSFQDLHAARAQHRINPNLPREERRRMLREEASSRTLWAHQNESRDGRILFENFLREAVRHQG